MSDSQKWSAFDEEERVNGGKKISADRSVLDAPTPKSNFSWKLLQYRLVFGGLVGFCTGATLGASKHCFFSRLNLFFTISTK